MPDKEEKIRHRAYEKWEREGRSHGHHERHWEEATREVELESAAPELAANSAAPKSAAPKRAAGTRGVKRAAASLAKVVDATAPLSGPSPVADSTDSGSVLKEGDAGAAAKAGRKPGSTSRTRK